jgi:S-formylglutathione hydrolase FrmB
MGGTCAVDLAVMHPEVFSAFVDIAGDRGPSIGSKDATLAKLFGGNTAAWSDFDPITVMNRHGRYTGLSGWFDIPGSPGARNMAESTSPDLAAVNSDPSANPEGQDAAANELCQTATAQGISCAVVSQPGKHDWPFAAQAFEAALPWLASVLGTPAVEPVQLPQGGNAQPH